MLQQIYDSIDPVAFSIGQLEVRWYGLAYLAGFILCTLMVYRIGRRWKIGINSDDMLVILLAVMIGTIVGGRLGFVIFYGAGYYLEHPAEIFAISNGGMSFHGGLVGIVVGGIVASKITKIKFFTMADLVAIAAPIGLFFGRCANFINGELWGAVTDLPWGVVFETGGPLPRHPTQLYEALLEGVVIFVVLYVLSRREKPLPRGNYLGLFLVMYGCFRILIEFVRQPDVQLGYLFGGWLTMGMVLSVPLIIAGVVIIVIARKKNLPQEGDPRALASETKLATGKQD